MDPLGQLFSSLLYPILHLPSIPKNPYFIPTKYPTIPTIYNIVFCVWIYLLRDRRQLVGAPS